MGDNLVGIFDNRNNSGNGHPENGYRRPTRFSAFGLLRHGFSQADRPRARRTHDRSLWWVVSLAQKGATAFGGVLVAYRDRGDG